MDLETITKTIFPLAFEYIYRESDHYSHNVPKKRCKERRMKGGTIREQTTKEGDEWEGREAGKKRQRMWVTLRRRSVHSGRGQRSAVSNPPCPLL